MAAKFTDGRTEKLEPTENGVCPYYLRGECTFGSKCMKGKHPPELSPELKTHDNHKDFELFNVRGLACRRCLE